MNRKYKERKRQEFKNEIFLKQFGHELRTQETDCQASPRFWVIKDYKRVLVPDGYGDDTYAVDEEGNDYTESRFLEMLDENGYDIPEFEESDYFEDKISAVNKLNNTEFRCFEQCTTDFIVPNTMFLTKAEAKHYLSTNRHNLTSRAHTYAMTAFRAPKVSRLLKVLAAK